jgi:hypothetical protein
MLYGAFPASTTAVDSWVLYLDASSIPMDAELAAAAAEVFSGASYTKLCDTLFSACKANSTLGLKWKNLTAVVHEIAKPAHTADLFRSTTLALSAADESVALVSASALADFYVGCRHAGRVPSGMIDRAEFNQLLKVGCIATLLRAHAESETDSLLKATMR